MDKFPEDSRDQKREYHKDRNRHKDGEYHHRRHNDIIYFFTKCIDQKFLELSRLLVLLIVLIPVIAGVSYEVLRLAGTSNSKIMDIVSRPGMWMQGLTTKEPDDSMIEVAIVAVEAVFDWKKYLEENFPELYPAGYFEREDQTGKNAQEITA